MKTPETIGHITYGGRREGASGTLVSVWVKIPASDPLNLALRTKGTKFARPQSERKASTVLCSLVATFDHQGAGVYRWQPKHNDDLYIEFPVQHAPEELISLVLEKAKRKSATLPAWLFKTGVLQVRSA